MFAGLFAKLAFGAVWSRVKTNVVHDWQRIPSKARLWIIGIVALIILVLAHQWYAHRELKAQYAAGYAKAVADIKAQQDKLATQYKGAKAAADTRTAASTEKVRKSHDATASHIDRNLADLFSLYYATDQSRGGPVAGVHGADGAAGSVRTQASADDRLAETPATDPGLIAITAKPLYVRAAECDRDYAALTAWEDQYLDYMQAYADWKETVVKTRSH